MYTRPPHQPRPRTGTGGTMFNEFIDGGLFCIAVFMAGFTLGVNVRGMK